MHLGCGLLTLDHLAALDRSHTADGLSFVPGDLTVAGWNKPADDTGGDFYDWDSMPDGRLIVVLGDVTGHGIGPALLAAACRAYARFSFGAGTNLPAALTQINAAVARDLDPSRFITFAGVACTPGTGDLEILSAGHGPILLYSASHDAFIEIESQGVPLGILPEYVSGPPTKIQLKKGDIFLLITDGTRKKKLTTRKMECAAW